MPEDDIRQHIQSYDADKFSIEALMEGFNGMRRVRESQTTADFPLLMADAIDRQMLVGYKEAPATWRDYVKISRVPDFRDVKRFQATGLEGTLPAVGQKGEYKVANRGEGQFIYHVNKYGRIYDISWEALLADDLGALQDTPQRMGRSARRTEYLVATQQFANPAFRGAGQFFQNNRNAMIGAGTALNGPNLAQAWTMMSTTVDADGQPIITPPKYLVVPPALELTARNILNSTIIREIIDAVGNVEAERNNYWGQMLQLRVNHYAPIVDGSPTANTAWYLFADPADVPAIEVGFLKGHEQPELFMKAADAVPVGGGAANPYAGDFMSDNVLFKVRHVVGGTRLDWRGAFCATGV